MKPYYDDGQAVIYHGDCREVLPALPAGAADSVVTDPPFGIDYDYGKNGWNDDPASYASLMREWIAEATRVVGDGPFWVWQGMPNAPRWHEWFPSEFRIFAACKSMVQFRPQPVQHSWDPVVFWGVIPTKPSVYGKDWHVQRKALTGAGRPKPHPVARSVEQVRYVIELGAGAVVLDPFMGSGTTLRAAKDLGRKAIGVEIEERYCEIAAKRLSQEALGLTA